MPEQEQNRWNDVQLIIVDMFRARGIPDDLIPRVPGHRDPNADVDTVNRWLVQARRKINNAFLKAKRQGRIIADPGEQGDAAEAERIRAWQLQMAQIDAQMRAREGGNVGAAMWNAFGENPALWAAVQRQAMGPMADFFWNQFPQQMNQIGDTIGDQLNLNADRINKTNLARGLAAHKERMLDKQMAGLKDIFGGFTDAIGSGLGGLGQALGGSGGFLPLAGYTGVTGGGGMNILPDGTVATAQDITDAQVRPRSISPRNIQMALGGVGAKARAALQNIGGRGARAGAMQFNQALGDQARRQNIGAKNQILAQTAQQNLQQLNAAALAKRGQAQNIAADARTRAKVMAAQNKARLGQGKLFSGLVNKLSNLFPAIG